MPLLKVLPALLLCLAACAPEAPAPGGRTTRASTERQGTRLQGSRLQGTRLQGTRLQGTRLQGATLAGAPLSGLSVEAGRLAAVRDDRTLTGAELVGLELVGVDDAGGELPFRVDGAAPDESDPSGETWRYAISFRDPSSGAWEPMCEPDLAGEAAAIPIAALWNERGERVESSALFTLACTSGVLAKCVRWGYRPWAAAQSGASLAEYHQACTRMARADYCGNGVTHTQDGTLIDIYDPLGIQVRTERSGLVFEAAWTPSGAYCVGKQRWNVVSALLLAECPERLALPRLSDLLAGCATMLAPPGTPVRVRNDSDLLNLSPDLLPGPL